MGLWPPKTKRVIWEVSEASSRIPTRSGGRFPHNRIGRNRRWDPPVGGLDRARWSGSSRTKAIRRAPRHFSAHALLVLPAQCEAAHYHALVPTSAASTSGLGNLRIPSRGASSRLIKTPSAQSAQELSESKRARHDSTTSLSTTVVCQRQFGHDHQPAHATHRAVS